MKKRTIARQVGTVVYQVLQRWGELRTALDDPQLPVKLRPLLQALLSRLAMATDEMDHALVQVQSALQNTLDSQKGRWILSSHRDTSSEYALSDFYKNELIQVVIDRTFIDEQGICWIIDFKTSATAMEM